MAKQRVRLPTLRIPEHYLIEGRAYGARTKPKSKARKEQKFVW